jgi:hypothetical protein
MKPDPEILKHLLANFSCVEIDGTECVNATTEAAAIMLDPDEIAESEGRIKEDSLIVRFETEDTSPLGDAADVEDFYFAEADLYGGRVECDSESPNISTLWAKNAEGDECALVFYTSSPAQLI